MLIAVFLPQTGTLYDALRSTSARRAIAEGMGLYTDGRHTALLPAPREGWFRVAVRCRDLLDDEPAAVPA